MMRGVQRSRIRAELLTSFTTTRVDSPRDRVLRKRGYIYTFPSLRFSELSTVVWVHRCEGESWPSAEYLSHSTERAIHRPDTATRSCIRSRPKQSRGVTPPMRGFQWPAITGQ